MAFEPALLRCKREEITIKCTDGPLKIKAWRLGDFACHLGRRDYFGLWVITHLGTGFQCSSAGVFRDEDDAAEAMEQIAELDWSDLSEAGRRKLGPQVRRVFAENKAIKG